MKVDNVKVHLRSYLKAGPYMHSIQCPVHHNKMNHSLLPSKDKEIKYMFVLLTVECVRFLFSPSRKE